MTSLRQVCDCFKRLHPDLKHRVRQDTLEKYQKAFESFTYYLLMQPDLILHTAEELDHLIMEYRTEADLTRSQHTLLVAAAEFFLPHIKGKLVYCREALKGRTQHEPVRHTVPLTAECTCLFAALWASRGQRRLGAAVVVQQGTGLRPSELLALKPGHIYIPSDVSSAMTLRLGATVSTKVKREQFVLIHFSKQPLVYELVRHLCNTTVSSERLFPFSYSFYNNSFKTAEEHYGLCIGTTAHSPRSGFATTAILAGESVKSVQSRGRWLCESSFQTYVDVAAASHIRSQVVTKRLAVTADWISPRLHQYFQLPTSHGQCSKLSPQNLPRHGSGPSGALHFSPEKAVSFGEVGRVAGATESAGANTTTVKGKGKGRGTLRKRGAPKQSIFD